MAAEYRTTLASLPAETLPFVLVRLPVDARARAAAVCRLWRDVLKDRNLWTRLDLSDTSGVLYTRITNALLLGAAAKAGGGLTALDASTAPFLTLLTRDALMEVAATNWAALTELSCSIKFEEAQVEALLQAAPLLCECRLNNVTATGAGAGRMLRNEPPFGPLRMSKLSITAPWPSNEACIGSLATALSESG